MQVSVAEVTIGTLEPPLHLQSLMRVSVSDPVDVLEKAGIPNPKDYYNAAIGQANDSAGGMWIAIRVVEQVHNGWDVLVLYVPPQGGTVEQVVRFYSKADDFRRSTFPTKVLLPGKAGDVDICRGPGNTMGLLMTCDARGDSDFPAREYVLTPQG